MEYNLNWIHPYQITVLLMLSLRTDSMILFREDSVTFYKEAIWHYPKQATSSG